MSIIETLFKITLLPPAFIFASILLTGCSNYQEVKENLKFAFPEYIKCDVVQVVDADIFHCQLSDGQIEKVRLIGVEIPESISDSASKFTKSYLRIGTPVKLEFDEEPRDSYGLILAYAYLPGGKILILCFSRKVMPKWQQPLPTSNLRIYF